MASLSIALEQKTRLCRVFWSKYENISDKISEGSVSRVGGAAYLRMRERTEEVRLRMEALEELNLATALRSCFLMLPPDRFPLGGVTMKGVTREDIVRCREGV